MLFPRNTNEQLKKTEKVKDSFWHITKTKDEFPL